MKKHLKKMITSIAFIIVLNGIVQAKELVPYEIQKVVLDRYPQAQNIEWSDYSGNEYLASFIFEEQEVMVFVGKDGKIIESLIYLNEAHIPQTIVEQIAVVEGAELCFVLEATSAENILIYRAKVKVNKIVYQYDFDNSGRIVSKRKM